MKLLLLGDCSFGCLQDSPYLNAPSVLGKWDKKALNWAVDCLRTQLILPLHSKTRRYRRLAHHFCTATRSDIIINTQTNKIMPLIYKPSNQSLCQQSTPSERVKEEASLAEDSSVSLAEENKEIMEGRWNEE
jgi:hypothetical protein